MSNQTSSNLSTQKKKNRSRLVFAMLAVMLVLAAGVFLAFTTRVVSVSGRGELYVLEANRTHLGTLLIEEGAAAIFRENSHWIGPIISKQGTLTVEKKVTITGPVFLFSNGLQLGENARVQGSVYLFSGNLKLQPGASIRHNAVLFAGDLSLGQGANIREKVVSFYGNVNLQEKASLQGDVVLFFGNMKIGDQAAVYGELLSFAGGLEMASKAILDDDAVLFFGKVHLFPEAQVKGNVIVTEGNATLEAQSTITGKLYLNPVSNLGRLNMSSEAQISRGVFKPENIDSIAGMHVAGWFARQLLKFIMLPVAVVCLLMALMFYLGRGARSRKEKRVAQARYAELSHQP